MAKKKEKKEAEQLIQTLKDIQQLFKKNIKAFLLVTDAGIVLTGVHALKDYDEGEEPGEEDIHVKFSDTKLEIKVATETLPDYLG